MPMRMLWALPLAVLAAVDAGAQEAAEKERPVHQVILAPHPHPRPFPWKPPPTEELRTRRVALAAALEDGVAVLLAREAPPDVDYHRYRPDPSLYYLTGIWSHPAALVLHVKEGRIAGEVLFLPRPSARHHRWHGNRAVAGKEARKRTGVRQVQPLGGGGAAWDPLRKHLEDLLEQGERRFHLDHVSGSRRSLRRARRPAGALRLSPTSREEHLWDWLQQRSGAELHLERLHRPLARLRAVKSPYEVEMMQEAADITGEALVSAMRNARPGMWEFEVMGIIEGVFLQRGAWDNAFASICGSGANSCILHYAANRSRTRKGDLVLCDVGAAFGWYAADITRTWPVSGRFTERQREVYDAVRAAQDAAEKVLRAGSFIAELHRAAAAAMAERGFNPFQVFWHAVGHHVGLQVHDPGSSRLRAGAVVTIEPGIYLPQERIGIRVEDMYLVTEKGHRRLSAGIPREAEEIESLVGSAWPH